jgi:hypothetical protein
VWLFCGGSILLLFAIAAVAFVFMKWGIRAVFRRRSEQKERSPDFMDELGRHR